MHEYNFKKANKSIQIEQIEMFKKRPLEDLQEITPIWACGPNLDSLMNRLLHPAYKEYIILYVNLYQLIMKANFIDANPLLLFGNSDLSDYRVMKVIKRWEDKNAIDPPALHFTTEDNKLISFSDGRHRTIAAYHLNVKQIPVALPVSVETDFRKIIQVYEWPDLAE